MEQGTAEWFSARLGKLTASNISKALMKSSTKGYQDYQAQLITERLTGQPTPHFTNEAMEWGTETEPMARAMYSVVSCLDVEEVGFVDHPKIPMSGASPDGTISEDGLLEIKCPNSATHIRNLISETPDKSYMDQMQWQMACTGRAWCDFVSFDPRLPLEVQIFIKRIDRDEERISEMEAAAEAFLIETSAMTDQLFEKMKQAA